MQYIKDMHRFYLYLTVPRNKLLIEYMYMFTQIKFIDRIHLSTFYGEKVLERAIFFYSINQPLRC